MLCLPSELANKIKVAITTRKLSPGALKEMTSAQRREFLAGIIGEQEAIRVNLLFERKTLLKNQERAMYSWAKEITGISKKAREETQEKIRVAYAEKDRRIYEPKQNENFLNEIVSDVFSKKYKMEVSLEEAQIITELTSAMRGAKEMMNPVFNENPLLQNTDRTAWGNGTEADKLNYGVQFGATKTALDNYVGALKLDARKRTWELPWRAKGLLGKLNIVREDVGTMINFIAENSRSIVASVDNSWFGRQGIKTLLTRPTVWGKNFVKSWPDMYLTVRYGRFRGDAIVDAVKAEIYSEGNYLNGLYENKGGDKLDIATGEEAFPTSAPEKIPLLGRLFKASMVAYEAGAMRMRKDIANKEYRGMEKNGIDLSDTFEVGSMNKFINSQTGRGKLPVGEEAQATVNKAFFSIKFAKSNIDTLLLSYAGKGRSAYARKKAALNLLQIVAELGVLYGISWALCPRCVEWNPTSANFGTIRFGNTRIDITGGMKSYVILVFRLMKRSIKSSTTGIVSKFNEGYGSPEGMSLLWDFTENKFSPMFSVIKELINDETFGGDEPTIATTAKNLGTPIIIQEGWEMSKDPNSANILLALIAEGLGFSANTYTLQVNWQRSTSDELEQFNATIGDKEFKKANDEYNLKLNNYMLKTMENADYIQLSNDNKKELIDFAKKKFKKDIFEEYGFKHKKGAMPEFEQDKEIDNKTIIEKVFLYAEAIGKDPISTFRIMFTDEELRKMSNDSVIVKAMSPEKRERLRKELGATEENWDLVEMDHIIPKQLGGHHNKSNLRLLSIEEHRLYTRIGNHLGKLLRAEKIDEPTAQRAMKDFNAGKISEEVIFAM